MMPAAMLEHVNVTVSDPQRTADMLSRLFGWKKRWEGPAKLGGYTVHVGTDEAYVAVYSYPPNAAWSGDNGRLNHIAVVVDDLDAVERKVEEAGYVPQHHADYEPGRRFYFDDHDGIEFEVVSYG
jgi:predicted enzyme related to lactoylglutathione lyase